MRKTTYYVEKTGTYHTYDFLEKRQHDPQWRDAYLQAKKSRRLETILILAVSLVVFTMVAFLFFTRTPKDKNNLNIGKQSSDYRSESSVVESSETTASTSKS